MSDFDLDLPGLDDILPRHSKTQSRELDSQDLWEEKAPNLPKAKSMLVNDWEKPSFARAKSSATAKLQDAKGREEDFGRAGRAASREVSFDPEEDLGLARKAREETKRQDANPADDILSLLDEMEPRPLTSKPDTHSASISPVPAQRAESDIGVFGTANSRRKPRSTQVSKQTSENRPSTAPQEVSRTLLKSKPASVDSPPSRSSITKVVIAGEIREIPEEDRASEDSSRPTDLNDRDSVSRSRTVEFTEPFREEKLSVSRKIAQAVTEDREFQRAEYQKSLSALESKHREELTAQQRFYETQIASLEAVLKHQESLGVISTAISANADTLNSLSSKYQHAKSLDDQMKTQEFVSKQQALTQLEQRLLAQQRTLEMEKQHMLEVLKRMQEEEANKDEAVQREREELRRGREELQQLQEFMREQERTRSEEMALEKHKVVMLREALGREYAQKMQEVSEQVTDLRLKQTLLEQQRGEMEQQSTAARLSLQQKFGQLESLRSQISELETKAARQALEAEERERAARSEWERLLRDQSSLQGDKARLEEEGRKLHEVSLSVQSKSLEIAQARDDLAREREEVLRMRQDAQSVLGSARTEASRADTRQRELATSMKAYEQMRFGLVRSLQTPVTRDTVDLPLREIQQKLASLGNLKRASTPLPRRPTFTASDYLKDLQGYERARGDFQGYLANESRVLLKAKLDLDVGFSESLAASFRAPKDLGSDSLKELTRSALSG